MKALILKSDGSIESPKRAADPLAFLGSSIELADGVTLRSFFLLLRKNPDLARLSPLFPGLAAALGAEVAASPGFSGVDFLELTKSVEMIGFPGPLRLEIYASVRGIRGGAAVDIRHEPIEAIADTPLKLGRLRHVIFGDRIEELSFDTHFSLFELLDALAWELGFHNAPVACAMMKAPGPSK